MCPPLPDFDEPPVTEVALSVQFDRLSALRTPQMGLLWSAFREDFPRVDEHPSLEPVVERFGVRARNGGGVRMEIRPTAPVPRCWFLNQSGTELIQVQQDRFAHNWRKVGEADAYPRYEYVRDRFQEELRGFQEFLAREGLGELIANQCEVTYVNHIVSGAGWKTHGQLADVLTVFNSRYSDEFLAEPEDVGLALRYVIPDSAGEPLGRLHVTAKPVYRRGDDVPMFLMTLTARGRPDGNGVDGVIRFMNTGREWIVRGFASITTSHMHDIWGRQDAE